MLTSPEDGRNSDQKMISKSSNKRDEFYLSNNVIFGIHTTKINMTHVTFITRMQRCSAIGQLPNDMHSYVATPLELSLIHI